MSNKPTLNVGKYYIVSFNENADAKRKGLKLKTASLHPGVVASDFQKRSETLLWSFIWFVLRLGRYIFLKDNKMGAQTTLHVV